MTDSPTETRGRKRSEQTRLAILAAAYELTRDVGYQALTIEGIAARAGSGKQTVYRWWPSKVDVLLEALTLEADLTVSVADHGSLRADIEAFLRDSAELLVRPGVAEVLRSLMSEAQQDPDFRLRFQEGFLCKRRAAFESLTTRAAERGDWPTHLDGAFAADLVFGLIWYRVLAAEPEITEQDIATFQRLLSA
ncbi:TetR/AcrR family transcriptional regulator [Tsukamurella sp. 8F]|uniref:TetR/AcrR family transcriptional regulator n=1 Tax=unclassified Tsukamurella TaxID=2633480 RepID=UPI0023B8C2D3|nr:MULTISPECIES: TetR/AcrR family transcriptional regulator [unclassified Tsukamurella]MDF0529064.1 TetR/AcrR family transcriptional regulator [Tsukamurella sp. 8J]MDF0587438.1 TetR/AcrR family transcriptional regulator [Tsukamurella sp. 8F]